jgi:hypothetical protein
MAAGGGGPLIDTGSFAISVAVLSSGKVGAAKPVSGPLLLPRRVATCNFTTGSDLASNVRGAASGSAAASCGFAVVWLGAGLAVVEFSLSGLITRLTSLASSGDEEAFRVLLMGRKKKKSAAIINKVGTAKPIIFAHGKLASSTSKIRTVGCGTGAVNGCGGVLLGRWRGGAERGGSA